MAQPAVVDGRHVFAYAGWTFETTKRGALSSTARSAMSDRFHLPHVPLPEMLFGDNLLQATHEASGWRVAFCAEDALATWATAQRDAHHVEATAFDVTYSCAYRGTHPEHVTPQSTCETLPLDRLREHAAILFYDDVILFEDDVRDLGDVECSVKLRVMPFGFLILCRFFARVDNKCVKLHDARYYHSFDTTYVLRDYETRHAEHSELQTLLQPPKTDDMTVDTPLGVVLTANVVYDAVTPHLGAK
ncbi:hypothetical protein SDRG_14166 [Saprolegnia diclina VS20]|uniref:TIP41-like protein n=1 Tax=Saprolegnia diclina (strain VS20) TaxID=1156394 RepID=T0R7M0_SAPDV|nr:hypothetical protein SDRG_14166 [Saprolegnia diclina VS20]EQC28073.1 hypothetical protein SDRG_14166 [Saprolegnia diclina VS20]|eukprot:XP_008618498.1 hypothetical protein SDRG_14166 [Saprolegnia diclina VS20]